VTAPLAARLTIDLDALAANYRTLVAAARGAEVAPVVKADGYGLGAAAVARRLMSEGARRFFVARIAEGIALREALGAGPIIYVLDGCPAGAASALQAADLTPILNSLDQVNDWRDVGGGDLHLMLDTGLNRLGLTENDLDHLGGAPVAWAMSHLACADRPDDPMNGEQRLRFEHMAARFPRARRSLAASDGLFLGHGFTCDMVRTGICLYGGGPEGRPDPRIRAVATFKAPILQIRRLSPGESVGYGAAFTATRPITAAVVAAGYADGVLRSASPKAFASLAGRRCAMLGRVSMDLAVFDVTGLAEAQPGAMMQLVGAEAPIDEIATASGTIAYEVLTRLGARAERRYIGGA
jgi:alanine racemase